MGPGSLETSRSSVFRKKTILSLEGPVTRHTRPAVSQSERTVNRRPACTLASIFTFGKKAGSIFVTCDI
jgi:hypothetical protein